MGGEVLIVCSTFSHCIARVLAISGWIHSKENIGNVHVHLTLHFPLTKNPIKLEKKLQIYEIKMTRPHI